VYLVEDDSLARLLDPKSDTPNPKLCVYLVEDDSLARLLLLLGGVLHLVKVGLALERASHLFKIQGLGFRV
jgi:hypothetical protein